MIFSPLLLVVPLLAQAAPVPADMAAYFEEIRQAGSTESARGSLGMVASIVVGQTILTFPKDASSGTYGMSYRNKDSFCVRPGVSPAKLAAWREEMEKKLRPVMERLRKAADTDHSGFVSTAEGSGLRRVYEFGAMLAFVAEHETRDTARLCNLLHVAPMEFDALIADYRALAAQLADLPGGATPAIPAELGCAAKPGA